MSIEKRKQFVLRTGVFLGIISIYSIGLINSAYSETRYPSTHGTQFLVDSIFVSFSNPYAILFGALVFSFFFKLTKLVKLNEEGLPRTELDMPTYLIVFAMAILMIILWQGILVY